MMKKISKVLWLLAIVFLTTGCFEDNDDNAISSTTNINDFVWKTMNATYLYQSEVPDLANDRFNSDQEYTDYLNSFSTPEEIFNSLKYLPETVDRPGFSVIYSNYFDVLNAQQGNTVTKGFEFNLYRDPQNNANVFGVITLVLNNSVADINGLQRGQVFGAVDGVQLTESNFPSLLSSTTYSLDFANYDTNGTFTDTSDDSVTLNGQSITLSSTSYTENPVHIAETLDVNGTQIGYLMYNGFNRTFDVQLNNSFANFAATGVQELVVDLRYNGGGSVQTAAYLASMITGQFNGNIFSKLFYNENLANNNRDFLFTNTIEGVGGINSLNLSRVYILTTNRRTASASELLINSLEPYIDVVVIGENTLGKTQASTLFFDSPSLTTTQGVDPSHTYALRLLVANSVNVNEDAVPSTGLIPDIDLSEVSFNLGTLGDVNEPLLAAAIADITSSGRPLESLKPIESAIDLKSLIKPFEQAMFVD